MSDKATEEVELLQQAMDAGRADNPELDPPDVEEANDGNSSDCA